jgi:hypothetical protein
MQPDAAIERKQSAPQLGAFFMGEPILDLFGEVRVTTADVDAWLRAVPRLEPGTARAAHYVEAWNVVDKIKRAKLDGRFDAIVSPAPRGAGFWWERFNWVKPV